MCGIGKERFMNNNFVLFISQNALMYEIIFYYIVIYLFFLPISFECSLHHAKTFF